MKEHYKFYFNFIPEKNAEVISDIQFPIGIEKIGPEQAKVAQLIAAYALHLAGVISEEIGNSYQDGIDQSVKNVDKFFSDAEFEIIK